MIFKGQICPGQHPPILDRDLFEAVQRRLAEQHNGYRAARASSGSLLMGRIFDDRGSRMSPSHSCKGDLRYRYYTSSALIQGQPKCVGSVARVPAAQVETVIVDAVRRHVRCDDDIGDGDIISTYVDRVVMRQTEISISLTREGNGSADAVDGPIVLTVPWSQHALRRRREIIAPSGSSRAEVLPIRTDTRVKLVTALARARRWLSEIEAGTATLDAIAEQEGRSKRYVTMTISLAFLAPSLVTAAVEGRLPHGIGAARLFDAPVAWSRQHQMLGLAQY